MSEESKPSQGTEAEGQSESAEGKEYNAGDLVAKKLIDENRGYRKKNSEYRAKLEDMEKQLSQMQEAKLQEEGKYKEAAEFYKTKAAEFESKYKDATSSYASNVVTSQVRAKAAEMGCIDYEALVKLAPMQDLYDHIDEDFNVKPDAIQSVLEMMQQKRPWLFKKPGPKIEDGVPSKEPPTQSSVGGKGSLDLARMLSVGSQKN